MTFQTLQKTTWIIPEYKPRINLSWFSYFKPPIFGTDLSYNIQILKSSEKCQIKSQQILLINKIMKTFTTLLALCIVLALVQAQIIPTILPNKAIIQNLIGSLTPSADCFEGIVTAKLNEGNPSELTYVACFVPAQDCKYTKCHKGFIVKYDSEETGLVEGFPNNSQAVFRLDVTSAADYYIRKSARLSPELNQIIDIACHQFDPTIASPPKSSSSSASLSSSLRASFLSSGQTGVYNLLKGDKFVYSNQEQKIYIPQYSFRPTTINNIYNVISPTQKLVLSDFDYDAATVDRQIKYDGANNIIQERSDIVGLRFSNTAVEGVDGPGNTFFQGKISLAFNKLKTKQQYNPATLDAALSKITTVFSLPELQKLRKADNLNLKVFPQVEKQDPNRDLVPLDTVKVGDLQNVLKTRTGAISEITTLNANLGSKRLLGEVIIFNKQYPLYQRTILGKTIKVSILVVAKLTNNNQVLVITGTLKLDFFGAKKDIVVFNRSQNVNFNWSYNHTFTGTWSFNIYIPLPPPVSFLGINFGFSATYNIPVNLSSNGLATATDYTCTFIANVGAGLDVDASAAIRAIVVEGGVFIKGTLVSVRTDPKLVLKYTYKNYNLNVTLSWYFYLRAFAFKWGFFWRYYKLFKGWSDRKIIAQWTISNGIQKKYPIWNFSKNYQL